MKAVILNSNRKLDIVQLKDLGGGLFEVNIPTSFILLNVISDGRKYLPNDAKPFEVYQQFETISTSLISDTLFRESGVLSINSKELKELAIFSCCSVLPEIKPVVELIRIKMWDNSNKEWGPFQNGYTYTMNGIECTFVPGTTEAQINKSDLIDGINIWITDTGLVQSQPMNVTVNFEELIDEIIITYEGGR